MLSQKLLFIPRPTGNASDGGDPNAWPLLDTSAVSLDGSGCDKPGTMFGGFRNQPNKCGVPAGSCLSNQLQDIVDADAAAMAAGNAPRKNVAALQAGAAALHDALPGASSPDKKRLALPATQLRNSIVTLTLNADSVRFVVNFSPGRIISAQLVDFNGRTVGGFVALSGNGRLAATIVNNGTIDASYYLSVVNCSAGVALIPSPGALAVAAGGVLTQQWACAVEDDAAANRNCTVVLQDARFVVIDTRLVKFYTNATVYDALPQLDGRALGTGVGAPQGGGGSCSALCPNMFNLLCAAVNGCWLRLAEGLLIIAALAAFAFWILRCGPCRLSASLSQHLGKQQGSPEHVRRVAPQQQLMEALRPMGLANVRFAVQIELAAAGAEGADAVQFLFSANPGQPLAPLAEVASGGEMSRFLLALKTCLAAADPHVTLLFDEIDAGVNGENILLSLAGASLTSDACDFSLSPTVSKDQIYQDIVKFQKEMLHGLKLYLKNQPAPPLRELIRRISRLK